MILRLLRLTADLSNEPRKVGDSFKFCLLHNFNFNYDVVLSIIINIIDIVLKRLEYCTFLGSFDRSAVSLSNLKIILKLRLINHTSSKYVRNGSPRQPLSTKAH